MVDQIRCELAAEEALHYGIAIFLFLDGGVVYEVDVLFEIIVFELCVAYLARDYVLVDEYVVWIEVNDCGSVA